MKFFVLSALTLAVLVLGASRAPADEYGRRSFGNSPRARWYGPVGPELAGPLLHSPRNGRVARRPAFPAYHPGDFVPHHVPLYRRVEVKDRHNIAPFAVPRVVAVRDPAICRRDCRCCEPRCVFVTVYVPPYACERVRVKKHGREIKLDYGKYEVEIEVEDGRIEIDYDD